METFLQKVADEILALPEASLQETAIIFPNRRASLFLKKHIAEKTDRPVWLPGMFSIEDFVQMFSDQNIADNITLLLELYEAHRLASLRLMSFEDFVGWGEMILRDFNDIDLYLVKSSDLFSYLSQAKALLEWNPEGEELTAFQTEYLVFYESLHNVYERFKENLIAKNIAYQGMLYRNMVENMDSIAPQLPYKHVIVVGFSALNKAEKEIFRLLKEHKDVRFFWDCDSYYMNDKKQEAGYFMRKNKQIFKGSDFNWEFSSFAGCKKHIEIIGVAGNTGQTRVAADILDKLYNDADIVNETAVVLADERVLPSMLNSIPDKYQSINVTMGYPLYASSSAKFLLLSMRLFSNAEKFSSNSTQARYYHSDLMYFLKHPYCKNIIAPETGSSEYVNKYIQPLINANKVFITQKEIAAITDDNNTGLCEILPEKVLNCNDFLNHLSDIFSLTAKKTDAEQNSLEKTYINACILLLNQFSSYSLGYTPDWSLSFMRKIITPVLKSTTIPFSGEPLAGLQIMGMLESRVLDFKNIIILSVNEGVLPSGKSNNSFIPPDIRNHFELPGYRDKDAIFAYHFYRILQRAENAYLIYNTDISDKMIKSGERSRFITQLIHEMPLYNQEITLKESFVNIPANAKPHIKAREIIKSPEILAAIKQLEQKGYSPSSLSRYLSCNLRFYYASLLKIEEQKEVEETMDAATVGSIIHRVMENFYSDSLNIMLNAEWLTNKKKAVPDMLNLALEELYPGGETEFGKNLLLKQIAAKAIEGFVDAEIKEIKETASEIIPLWHEKEVSFVFDIDAEPVKVHGRIDRVDSRNGRVRIIDYKSGNVKKEELNIESVENIVDTGKYEKALQLLIYCKLFSSSNDCMGKPLTCGIVSFRTPSQYVIPLKKDQVSFQVNKPELVEVEKIVTDIIREIRNPEVPFRMTENEKHCEYCPYLLLCK